MACLLGTIERLMSLASNFSGFNRWVTCNYIGHLGVLRCRSRILTANNYRALAALLKEFSTSAGK